MEQITLAALGTAVVALLFVRSLRRSVHALNARLEKLEDELHAFVIGDAS